ncbi:MAG: ATP-binding protein [Clostridia bacterium]|nr:ATP-binding protein [Clostridia bacterium]
MSEAVRLSYDVSADDFTHAGEASGAIKRTLKKLGIDMEIVRRVSIAVYEGEINMVIHANGGVIEAAISPSCIEIWLKDKGPGIKDIDLAMQEGYSTARDHIRALGFGAGMGLPNIKKYTDEMKIDTEIGVGTTVYMKVNFT